MRSKQSLLLALLFVAALRMTAGAGLPEPEIVFYGKVFNNGALVTAGTLRWTLTPVAGGTPVTVQAALAAVPNGFGETFSYLVQLPARSVIAGEALEANRLNLTDAPAAYTRAATVNNGAATLVAPATAQLSLGSADRGRLERVDLLIAGDAPPPGTPPAAPQPVLPANGVQGLAPTSVLLDWLDASGASSYGLLFWRDGDPVPSAPNIGAIYPSLLDLGPTLQADTRYLWQVVAVNTAGSTPGPRWSFTTTAPGSAQVSLLQSSQIVYEQDGVARIDALLRGTASGPVRADYLTRETGSAVAGVNFTAQAGTLDFSSTQTARRIDVPILNDGAARDDRTFEVLLRNVINAAAPAPQVAVVRIVDESLGSILNYLLGRTTNPAGLDRNTDGKVDAADLVRQSNNLPPFAPVNPQPVAGAQGVHPLPVLTWSATSPRDKSYQVYLWPAAQTKPAQPTQSGLTQPKFAPAQPLAFGTDYFWQVVAVGQSASTPGPVWSFRTMDQPAVLVVSPNSGGTFAVGSTLAVQWQTRVLEAGTGVRLELWRGGTRQAILGDGFTSGPITSTSVTIPNLPTAGDYVLRVVSTWLENHAVSPNYDESDAMIRISAP